MVDAGNKGLLLLPEVSVHLKKEEHRRQLEDEGRYPSEDAQVGILLSQRCCDERNAQNDARHPTADKPIDGDHPKTPSQGCPEKENGA